MSHEQERIQIYPPTHLHRSIPLTLDDAQARIANYLALADARENTYLHPDAQITSSGITRSSQGGSLGGLILSHLRRVEKGLNGERIEIDPKLLEEDWEKGTGEKPSDDGDLDAVIAQGGYGAGKKGGGEGAEGKNGKRKREEMETQADSVTLLNSARRQTQAQIDEQLQSHGQSDDTEGWQTMESYQREMEDDGSEEGDIGQRHNFRQQTEPEPQVQDTNMDAGPGAEDEVDREVRKDLQVGKEKVKKKRKRNEEGLQGGENVERQDFATKGMDEEGRKAKKSKTNSTEWSFESLKTDSHSSNGINKTAKEDPPAKPPKESKKIKTEKKKKSETPLAQSTTTPAGLTKDKDTDALRMPPPKIPQPKKPQPNGLGPSVKPKDSKASIMEKKPKSQKNNKASDIKPPPMNDLMRQSIMRQFSPMPSRSSASPAPLPKPNGNQSLPPASTNGSAHATPLQDPRQKKKKKDKSKTENMADEAYAEAQTNGMANVQSAGLGATGDKGDGGKAAADKEVRKKAKKERDKAKEQAES
ncbi:MAG: hypothetical protein Q9165_002065 [Trypethelium subeluteriae]